MSSSSGRKSNEKSDSFLGQDDGVEMEPSNNSQTQIQQQTSSLSNIQSARAISMPLSITNSGDNYKNQLLSFGVGNQKNQTQATTDFMNERSANASLIPFQQQHRQNQDQNSQEFKSSGFIVAGKKVSVDQINMHPGPSPLVRQLSEKVRVQAERLQIMEAYKALCERRILDLDPDHDLPVMPYHLGTGNLGSQSQSEQKGQADFKRQLALKEQDLYYTKQRNERLLREIEQLKNHGSQQYSNNDALRKEIELNEFLQNQIDMYKQKMGELSQTPQKIQKKDEQLLRSAKSVRSQTADQLTKLENCKLNLSTSRSRLDQDAQNQNLIQQLREQVHSLQEEKNILLDYIDDNIDKFKNLSDKKQESSQFHQQDKKDQEKIFQLQQEVENLLFQNNELTSQNQSLIRQQYSSPNFAVPNPIVKIYDNQPQTSQQQQISKVNGMQEGAEETFGQAIQFSENNLMQPISAPTKIAQQNKDLSPHSARSFTEDGRSADRDSGYRKKCKELEMRLKATQENVKTISSTLNETQAELEQAVRQLETLRADLDDQIRGNTSLTEINKSNIALLDQLKGEKNLIDKELKKVQSELSECWNKLDSQNQKIQQDKEKLLQYEKHIQDLKQQEGHRLETVTLRWEETVDHLTKELENTKQQVKEREQIFSKFEENLNKKILITEAIKGEKTKLEEKIGDLSAEVNLLQNQKQEKDQKLRNQIRKNEELLNELQELSEAVHALKNDKEFTMNSQLLDEREQIIKEYNNFMNNKQKRALDRIFSTILKVVENIKEFSKTHKSTQQNQHQSSQNYMILNQIDGSLENIAKIQKQLSGQNSQNDIKSKLQLDIKVFNEMFKDLETLVRCLADWNDSILHMFKRNISELNETQKQLFAETDEKRNLHDQLHQ